MKTTFSISSLAALVLIGCASSQTTGGIVPGQAVAHPSTAGDLAGTKVLLMPIPDGGNSEDGLAPGSGAAMTADLRDEILRHGMSPLVTEATTLQAAVEQANSMGYDFVIKAVFTDWQDNATEWSGRADHAGLSAELYDARASTLLATATHKEKGSSLSLISQDPSRFYRIISSAVLAKFIPAITARRGASK